MLRDFLSFAQESLLTPYERRRVMLEIAQATDRDGSFPRDLHRCSPVMSRVWLATGALMRDVKATNFCLTLC